MPERSLEVFQVWLLSKDGPDIFKDRRLEEKVIFSIGPLTVQQEGDLFLLRYFQWVALN